MQKSSIEKLLKAEGHYAGDLVSLDFKSQSLHSFLQNVVQLVNQHSQRINTLQIDKITTQQVKKGNINLTNASKISPVLLKQISGSTSNKNETFSDTIQSLSANFTNQANSLQYLFQNVKKTNQKLDTLGGMLDNFDSIQNVKESIRKSNLQNKKFTQDQCDKITNRIKELEMKTNKKISQFQNLTKDLQKKTLWKITECETSLLKKITPQYVDKALVQLQSKIHNDIANNKNQQMNELKFNLQTLKSKLQSLTRNTEDNQKQNKMLIKQLQQQAKAFERRQKIDQDKRQNQSKIKQLLIKIDRLEKRQDPQELQLRIMKNIAQHNQKINNNTEKLKKLDSDLESMHNVMSSMGGMGGSGADPHKICQIDGDVRRLRDSNRTNQVKLQSLEEQVKRKLLTFEQRIMTTLGMLKTQDNFVSRQQMYESLTRLRQPVMQKLNDNQNLIYEINGKLSKLQIFQKATKRKIKQMTKGDDLNKILDLKMNTGQADAQFNAVNMKMQNIQIVLNKVRMEVDANSSFLKLLESTINEPEEGINIIGPRQKVFPAKCLGCGQKHIPTVHDNNMMQGTDGKYYKVDMNSYVYDQKQVYGVTPSQIAVYDSGVKRRITSATNRPTSSRTNLRPGSAKHF